MSDLQLKTLGMLSIENCNNNNTAIASTVYRIDNTCYDRIHPAYTICTESRHIQNCSSNNLSVQYLPCDEGCHETFVEAKAIHDTSNVNCYDCTVQDTTGCSQPMITYCQVMKPQDGSSLGISFQRGTNNTIRIQRIDPNSPFARPNCLKPGDEVIAINGMSLRSLSPDDVFEGHNIAPTSSLCSNNISITVWNPNGDPNTFLNSAQVPTSDCRLGIVLQNKVQRNGRLFVRNICDGGAFCHSLLGPGHQIVSINNEQCSYLPSYDAVQLLHSTNANNVANNTTILYHHKNIVSRIPPIGCNKDVATVVSQEPVLKISKAEKRTNRSNLLRRIGLVSW